MEAIIRSISIKTGSVAESTTVTHLSLQRIGIDCSADGKTGGGYTYSGKRHHHFLHLLKWCLGFIAAPAVSREKFHRRMVHLSTTPLQRVRFFYIFFTTPSQAVCTLLYPRNALFGAFSIKEQLFTANHHAGDLGFRGKKSAIPKGRLGMARKGGEKLMELLYQSIGLSLYPSGKLGHSNLSKRSFVICRASASFAAIRRAVRSKPL